MPLRSTFSGASINGWKSISQIQPTSPSDTITPSPGSIGDNFGFRICTNSTNAYMASGAIGDGTVYVFYDNGTGYVQQQQLSPSVASGNFGSAVTMNSTGDYLAVGDSGTNEVYIYNRSVTTWSLQATISVNVSLGQYVLDFDTTGSRIIVGNYSGNEANIYSRSGTSWSLEQQLTDSGNFGASVAMNTTGDLCYVGQPAISSSTGAIKVYTRSGTTWTLKLTKTTLGSVAGDQTGNIMCLSWDGINLITNQDVAKTVVLFQQAGTIPTSPTVDEQGSIYPSGFNYQSFGRESIAINNDGTKVLVKINDAGQPSQPDYIGVYSVVSGPSTPFSFAQERVLEIPNASEYVGQSLAIATNGGTTIGYVGDIRLPYSTPPTQTGAVYLFDFL